MGLLKDKDLRKILSGEVVPDTKKLSDGEGLYVELRQLKAGLGMYWNFDYTFNKKRLTLRIGKYPLIKLGDARERLREAKVDISKGIDPGAAKRAMRVSSSAKDNFKTLAFAWLEDKEGGKRHKVMISNYFANDIFPIIGGLSVDEVKPLHVVDIAKRVSNRGSYESARRCGRWIYHIYRYGKTLGIVENNPADIDLSLIIPIHIPEPHAAITEPAALGRLLVKIDYYTGMYLVRCMLKLAVLMMKRPHNLVGMEWSELDFDDAMWTIEARKLKNRQHIKEANREQDALDTPLCHQAIVILRQLADQRVGDNRYVFPNQRKKTGHMVPDTVRAALRVMGYEKDEMSGHGFRAMGRTMIEERLNFPDKIIEMQLGHSVKTHKGAYDRTTHLPARREMMQAWADYVDELRAGAEG